MASHHGNSNKQHSEPAKMEQIITEFFPKTLHIILESRCPYVSSRNYSGEQCLSSPSSSSSSSSSARPRDKWFNLALKDCSAALENIDFWRQSNLEPMFIDVVLVQRPNAWDAVNCSPKMEPVRSLSKERYWNLEHDEFGIEGKKEKIVERWIIQYESRKANIGHGSGSKRSSCTSSQIFYKKTTLLLRSLYVAVRILPGYKLYRDLTSSAQIRTYNLCPRVSSFAEPFTRSEEAEMQQFVFTPVDTSCGRLCLSVWYRSSLSDFSSEPSTPMSPQFIPDYVGSPMAEPLKRFPSAPVPQFSQSSFPLERHHSWSYDLYRASPPSAIPSPSPTYSESQASISQMRAGHLPPTSRSRHLPDDTPQVHTKNTSFDEYLPSPTFSTSPSLSPPTHTPGSYIRKALLRSGSAPVNIPESRLLSVPFRVYNQMLPPSPPLKGIRPASTKMDVQPALLKSSSLVDKLFSSSKDVDDGDKLSVVKMQTNSSPQKSFSRSSSRVSFQDDYDDSEFSGPFVVDDDDVTDPGKRLCSFNQARHQSGGHEPGVSLVRKSHVSAGTLISMLKKAPPLRQDSDSMNLLQDSTPGTVNPVQISDKPGVQHSSTSNFASSVNIPAKTTADALEELRGYRDMKDLLLKQGGKSQM
nr:autophagy-related protein 13B [Ipomoea batatas]GMC96585.1 autophagy-related protein 13B [Ipomoea batatas]